MSGAWETESGRLGGSVGRVTFVETADYLLSFSSHVWSWKKKVLSNGSGNFVVDELVFSCMDMVQIEQQCFHIWKQSEAASHSFLIGREIYV